jgi:glutamate formiminotransferase/formiminotetrahydrofolate cyclodeaminase
MPEPSRIIECVPNFSEGRDASVHAALAAAITSVPGVKLLGLEPDASYHRVVVTFVGEPEPVAEAAFRATRVAQERIDMRTHQGGHPRMGALDVCPFVPVKGVSLAECAALSKGFGARVGSELGLPVYLYEAAASRPERKNLAKLRAGEYEALPEKMTKAEWVPDFGPHAFVPTFGAMVTGARFFLVAYNVDVATGDLDAVNAIAYAIREIGVPGQPVGKKLPGKLRFVKAIGVPIPDRGMCQVSINLTNYLVTPPHVAFEEVVHEASARGLKVTGSEVVGLTPLEPVLMAAEYHLHATDRRRPEMTEADLVAAAQEYLGLSDFTPFDPACKIIEYAIRSEPQP